MKRFIVVMLSVSLAIMFGITVFAFADEYNIEPGDTITITKAKDKINKVTDVPWLYGNTNTSYAIGDTAYFQIVGGISVYDFRELEKDFNVLVGHCDIKNIDITIFSGGGGADTGFAMADFILSLNTDYKVTTRAMGTVASASVIIFLAGEKRICGPHTTFMVHEPKLFKYLAMEGKDDIRSQNEMMDMLIANYYDIVCTRTNLTKEKIDALCARTTFFTAEQALEWGFVHEIM